MELSELGITPSQVIRVFGLRRSGNHAVINWLTRNAPGRAIFFNNCRVGHSPFTAHNGIEVDGVQVGRPGDDAREHAKAVGDGAVVFISYENTMPWADRRKAVSPGVPAQSVAQDVIIVRDFLNWSASLVKKMHSNAEYSARQRVTFALRLMDLYAQVLDEMLNEARTSVVIRYDAWHADPGYRRDVLGQMGFDPRDDSTGKVEAYGNGSSFQPGARDAQELRPLDRWKAMQDDPEYRILLWLVAQDAPFMTKVERVFPDCVGPIGDLTAETPYMGG